MALFQLTASDVAGLRDIVTGQQGDNEFVTGVRTLSGSGNNLVETDFGAADTPFLRLTGAYYGDYNETTGNRDLNPIFDGLDARAISNVLGHQEAELATNAKGGNIFFMAFGQYFDHGLDFILKGGNGSIAIGGVGYSPNPAVDNPADLTRGSVIPGTGTGVPQHINKTSAFVDQNQAYGSNDIVGQLLRESDGAGGTGARLLQGIPDPSNTAFNLLPTLRELLDHHRINETVFVSETLPEGGVTLLEYYGSALWDAATGTYNAALVAQLASDFMGSSHALLLDTNPGINLLDHFVAGDGRANENVSLTAVHTIWARNHNFHVANLEAAGFAGTPEEIFQAAKALNEAEYQRVVFDEFADMLIGGMRGNGTHGHEAYDATTDAGISHEFAAAVYRVGHSLISDTLTVIGADGQPQDVRLVDAFLNPTNNPAAFNGPPPPGYVPQPGFAQLGANAIIAGTVTQVAEEVDFNIVDAVRNDLVRIRADLFAFNVARGRDVGLGTLNQVRSDLQASTNPYIQEALSFAGNLDPYSSWEDFQTRNGLSDEVINQFKQTYPDLVLAAADIADFSAINPNIEVALQGDGTGIVKGIDRVDLWVGGLAEQHINGGMVGQTFWVVLHEQFDRLQQADRFYYTDRFDNFDFYQNIVDGQNFADIIERNTGLTGLQEKIFEAGTQPPTIAIDGLDVAEFASNSTIIGTLSAINAGAGVVTFELIDDAGGRFVLAGDQLRVANGLKLDFEQAGTHSVRVAVSVNGTLLTERTFTIAVQDVTPETVVGDATSNTFVGDIGNDSFDGAGGVDHLYGRTGNDTYYVNSYTDAVYENAGEGDADRVYASANYALTAGSEVELLAADPQSGTAAITLIGNAFSQRLAGNNGNNVLSGGGGIDSFEGFDGNDIYVVDHASEQITESAGQGSDGVYTTVSFTLATGLSIERLVAAPLASTSAIDLTGNEIRQVIVGNNGVNTLKGGGGNDSLYGMGGDDVIDGGDGNDHLFGGTGVDYFQFDTPNGAATGIDRIYDFTPADFIRINAAGIAVTTALAASDFVLGTAALDASDRVLYDQASGAVFFDADGTGLQIAKLLAVLDTKPAVSAEDFQLY